MTAVDTDRVYFQLFGRQLDVEVWDDETTALQGLPFPGACVPSTGNAGAMTWRTAGRYVSATGEAVEVMLERGGHTDMGARYVWREVGDEAWIGWDAPTRITQEEAVLWTGTAAPRAKHVVSVVTDDGVIVAILANDANHSTMYADVFVRTTTTGWTELDSLASLPFDGLVTPFTTAELGVAMYPALTKDTDGSVLLFLQRHSPGGSSTRETQIDVWRAPRDADWSGLPWTLEAEDVLEPALTAALVTEHPGSPGRMAVGVGGGQVLLVMENCDPELSGMTVIGATAVGCTQWAGASVDRLEYIGTIPIVRPALVRAGRTFVLAGVDPDTNHLLIRLIGNAFIDASSATTTDLGEVTAAPVSILVDDRGWVWVYACTAAGVLSGWVSRDGGQTWWGEVADPGTPAPVALLRGVQDIGAASAAWWQGRAVLLVSADGATGAGVDRTNSIVAVHLGGSSYATMPASTVRPAGQEMFFQTWTARDAFAAGAELTINVTGAPVRRPHATTARWEVDCDSTDSYELVATNTDIGGATAVQSAISYCAEVTAGTLRSELGNANYLLRIEHTSTGVAVIDGASSTTLATISVTGDVEVWATLTHSTGLPVVRIREVRPNTTVGVREYLDGSIECTGGASFNGIRSLQPDPGVAPNHTTVLWSWWCAKRLPAEREYLPEVPVGRPVTAAPDLIDTGLRLAGMRGAGRRGDTWTVTPASESGPAYSPATADAPTPRLRFESSAWVDGAALAFRMSPTNSNMAPILVGWIETNAPAVRLDWRDAGSWITGPVLHEPVEVTMTVLGRTATADVGFTSTTFVEEGELVGGTVVVDGVAVEIVANTAGTLGRAGGVPTVITIEAGHNLGAVTEVWYPRTAFVIAGEDVPLDAKGYRLVALGSTAPTSGTWRCKHLLGRGVPAVKAPGFDTKRTFEDDFIEIAGESGYRRRRKLGPTVERREITWQDQPEIWLGEIRSSTAPRWVEDANGTPIGTRGETMSTMRAFVESVAPTGVPVVYIPAWRRADGTTTYRRNRQGDALLCTLQGPWTIDHAGTGHEGVDDVVRGGAVLARELR